MAANANVLPGQQITGNEGQDLETLIRQEVEKMYAANKTQLQTQQADLTEKPSEVPIKLKVFGQDFTFNDSQSASQAVEQALAQVRDEVSRQTSQLTAPGTGTPGTTGTKENPFDKEKFATMVGEDPLKGLDYALSHLLFNGQTDSAADVLRGQLGASAQQRQNSAKQQFRERYPSFIPTNQTVHALDQIRQNLGLSDDSVDSWEAAYALGVARGIFQVPTPQPNNHPQTNDLQENAHNFVSAPPNLGRSVTNTNTPNWIQKAEQLPTDQLEQLLANFSGQ